MSKRIKENDILKKKKTNFLEKHNPHEWLQLCIESCFKRKSKWYSLFTLCYFLNKLKKKENDKLNNFIRIFKIVFVQV